MAKAKKRAKKYDPKRSAGRVVEHLLRNHAVVYLCSLDQIVLMDCKHQVQVIPSGTTARAITDLRHQWTVDCAILCRDQFEKEYLVTQQIATTGKYYHAELIDVLNKHHQELIKTCNDQHIINYGWFATVNDQEIKQETQELIYRKLGGFNCLNKSEAKKDGFI